MSDHSRPHSSPTARHRVELTVAVLFAAPAALHAYIDPGTGSVLVQTLIATIVGALFVIKTWWHRIKNLFAKRTDAETNVAGNTRPVD